MKSEAEKYAEITTAKCAGKLHLPPNCTERALLEAIIAMAWQEGYGAGIDGTRKAVDAAFAAHAFG
jgi:hypothetical protein